MNIKVKVAAAAALLVAAGVAGAAEPNVAELAAHPACTAVCDAVYVRGAVAVTSTHEAVPGATVRLEYGNEVRRA